MHALSVMSKQIRSRLSSYFQKWKTTLEFKKFGVNVHLKELILRLYKLKMQTAFNTWKNGKSFSLIASEQGVIEQMQEEGMQLQGDVNAISKEIQ